MRAKLGRMHVISCGQRVPEFLRGLARCEREGSRIWPAVTPRADLAMRGFAISFLTLARVALPDSFLAFFNRHTSMMISRPKPFNSIQNGANNPRQTPP